MELAVVCVLFVSVAIAISAFLKTRSDKQIGEDAGPAVGTVVLDDLSTPEPLVSFRTNSGLISAGEQRFFIELRKEVAGIYYVCMKVRIADVISHKCRDRKVWFREFGKMAQKHFDFVLLDVKSLRIKAAIELDDSSHSSKKVKERDQYVNELCGKAGLKLLRIKVEENFDFSGLHELMRDASNENHKRVL